MSFSSTESMAADDRLLAPLQQSGNLPPYPPNYNPNGPPPGMFPPFPPPQGFVAPPFPPNFHPGASSSANGANGFRPPPTPGAFPARPAHPGLGLPPLPAGMPAPPSFSGGTPLSSAPPNFVPDPSVKTTKVFVGSIAPGINDQTLTDLLNVGSPRIH